MSKTELDVLVVGDTAIDNFYEVEKLPKANTAAEVTGFRQFYGGMGANTAVVGRSIGLKTGLVSVIGTDAEDYRMYLQNLGINLYLKGIFGDTTRSLFFKTNADLISFFYKGVTEKLGDLDPVKDLELTKTVVKDVGCVYMARTYLKLQHKMSSMCKKKFIVYNPGYGVFKFGEVPEIFYKILKNTTILILNHHELSHLQKMGFDYDSRNLGPKVLLITKGDSGCAIHTKNEEMLVPIYKTKTVDASGAGDAFNAGFIAGQLRKYDLYNSVKLGNATASFIVEKWGCQTNLPTWDMVIDRYNQIP